MRLKGIELYGFKSFQERCYLSFPPKGLSVIVGPNGCGKSNIVDAILWALGEMKPSSLRLRNMEDVIFSGTEGIKPASMAEVSLVFEEPQTGKEIRITRRLFRSGESQYLINKRPCRLKDIRDFFLGTGLGPNTYAVIPQGEVEALISAHPHQIRGLIEEAAGTSRLEERKREILKKIEETKGNISRLEDLIGEVKRQADSLRHQAERAKKFKAIRAELETLEIKEAGIKWWALYQEAERTITALRNLEEQLDLIKVKRIETEQRICQLESEQELLLCRLGENKEILSGLESEKERLKKQIRNLQDEMSRAFERKKHLEERLQALSFLISSLEEENDRLKVQLNEVEQTLGTKRLELEYLELKLREISPLVDALQEKKETLRRTFLEKEAERIKAENLLREAEKTLNALISKQGRLTKEKEALEIEINQVEKDLSRKSLYVKELSEDVKVLEEEISGKRAEALSLEKGLETLRGQLQSLKAEREALELRYKTLLTMQKTKESYPEILKRVLESPSSFGLREARLLEDLVEVERGYEKALEAMLGERLRAVLVNSVDEAEKLIHLTKGEVLALVCSQEAEGQKDTSFHTWIKDKSGVLGRFLEGVELVKNLPPHFSRDKGYVTLEGLYLDRQGVLWTNKGIGTLERKNLIKELEGKIKELSEKLTKTEANYQALRKKLTGLKEVIQNKEAQREEKERKRTEAELHLKELEAKVLLLQRKAVNVNEELQETAAEIALWEKEKIKAKEGLEKSKDNQIRLKGELETLELKLNQTLKEKNDIERKKQSLREELAKLEERLGARNAYLMQLFERITRAKEEQNALKNERENLIGRIEELKIKETSLNEKLSPINDTVDRIIEEMQKAEDTLKDISQELNVLRQKERSLFEEETRKSAELSSLRSKLEVLKGEMFHWEGVLKTFGITPEQALNKLKEAPAEEDLFMKKENLRKALEELRDVYLGAIEEYEEVRERLEFLERQKADLEESLRELERSIKELESRGQEIFLETMEALNEVFKDMVGRLFQGGKGELVIDGRDGHGVRIFVQPLGKKLKTMELLSRGEKTMASIAFFMSLFFIKPAPFCIMDEVDSALDETNLERFIGLLQDLGEQCQFILVTHKKKTVEAASYVYGVTMEIPGISKVFSLEVKCS